MGSGSRTIKRAVEILRAVSKLQNRGAGLARVAKEAGLPFSTTHRIITGLVEGGLVHQNPQNKKYFLSIEFFNLGAASQQFNVKDRLSVALDRICHRTEDTVYLMVKSGNEALCLDRLVGKFPIRAETLDVGGRRPLGIGTGSLALLAFLPDAQTEIIINANKLFYPSCKNLSADDIRGLVKKASKTGFVLSEELFFEGITALAFPIYAPNEGLIAAISVAAISKRLKKDRQKEVAKIITSEIEAIGFAVCRNDENKNCGN